MITSLTLRNFKAFVELDLPLGAITLLTGVNAMGKSSVFQSILCVQQSHEDRLRLRGEYVQLGRARDVLYHSAREDQEVVQIGIGEQVCRARSRHHSDLFMEVLDPPVKHLACPWQHLSCERQGPASSSEMAETTAGRVNPLGSRGEFALHYVFAHQADQVRPELRHEGMEQGDLLNQIDAWLSDVAPGAQLRLAEVPAEDRVRGSIRFRAEGGGLTNDFRLTNVGFGLTYVLPVLVAGLALPSGALLLIENPEAHLHPRAQTRMGLFLAKVAASGVQVMVETHSDHLLNGVRLAVHGSLLQPNQTAIHFFEREWRDARFVHRLVSPRLDRHGRFDVWPEGFFDEWDHALDRLLMPAE